MPKRRCPTPIWHFQFDLLLEIANRFRKEMCNEKVHISLLNFISRAFRTAIKKNIFNFFLQKVIWLGGGQFLSRRKSLKNPNTSDYILVLVVTRAKLKYINALLLPPSPATKETVWKLAVTQGQYEFARACFVHLGCQRGQLDKSRGSTLILALPGILLPEYLRVIRESLYPMFAVFCGQNRWTGQYTIFLLLNQLFKTF